MYLSFEGQDMPELRQGAAYGETKAHMPDRLTLSSPRCPRRDRNRQTGLLQPQKPAMVADVFTASILNELLQ